MCFPDNSIEKFTNSLIVFLDQLRSNTLLHSCQYANTTPDTHLSFFATAPNVRTGAL